MRSRTAILSMAAVGCMLLAASIASAGTKTSARLYEAFKANGKPALNVAKTEQGSCFTGSIEVNRDDAWRCTHGNYLYDPCFSSSKANGIVLCVTAPWKTSALELKLTKALPTGDTKKPSTKTAPWAIETSSGLRCVFGQMGPFISRSEYGDYVCNRTTWLWNLPNRSTEPWTIHVAPTTARTLTEKAKIKIAWF
jgi:hypothetical protein